MALPGLVGGVTRLDDLFAGLPRRLTVEQLADVLGVETATAYIWLQRGLIPGYKIGRSWLVLRDEVRDHLAANRNRQPPDQQAPQDDT